LAQTNRLLPAVVVSSDKGLYNVHFPMSNLILAQVDRHVFWKQAVEDCSHHRCNSVLL